MARFGARCRTEAVDPWESAVAGALAGDEAAFRTVYRAIQPGLLRYLGALVGANDADDLAAEAWSQVCRDLHRFRGDGDGFRAWVTTIARHRALDHLRAARRRPTSSFCLDDVAERAGNADVHGEAVETLATREALALVAALPPEQAEAVLLRTVIGVDAVTAARILGKRAGAVRMATHRGLRALAARLDEADESASDTFEGVSAGEVT